MNIQLVSMKSIMKISLFEGLSEPSSLVLPVFSTGVSAGFPSPADDYVEDRIDLNKHLIKRPSATFFARANGNSLLDVGIKDGDLLIIDRSLKPIHGDVVIAAVNGEMTCKLLDLHNKCLLAANDRYPAIEITDDIDMLIEGVVSHSIRYHRVRPR